MKKIYSLIVFILLLFLYSCGRDNNYMDTCYKRKLNFWDKYSYTVEFIKEEAGYLVLKITVPNSSSKDEGGHLIGRRFGGSEKVDNLVPMDSHVNGVEYKPDDLRFHQLFGKAYFIPFKGKSAIVKIMKTSFIEDKISFEEYFFSGTYEGKYSNDKPKRIYVFVIRSKNISDK